jgi:phage recombination protein Bet
MTTALETLTGKLAARLDMGDGAGLIATLKATAFKGQVSDDQMTALMVVANQYGLNPWTKEIYAFPDKNNGIVPVVGVDGWARILNSHPQFDGMEFEQDDKSCTCVIYRKDRSRPIRVTEYMEECRRNLGPWQTHPKRMLRHKAMIQCARLAFSFAGIYDPDEAEGIIDSGIRNTIITKDITPDIDPELLDKARDKSLRGTVAFQSYWTEVLDKSQRVMLKGELPSLKDAASKADQARTVDQSTGEIRDDDLPF